MSDFKNKFEYFLFDEEPETEIDEEIDTEEEEEAVPEKPVEKFEESPFKAKDILFHKGSSSAFIDADDDFDINKITEEEKQAYEMSSQISPIFGLLKEEKKKVITVTPEITEAQVTRPADSYLDIITSPIYGYGNKEDAMDNNYDVKGIGEDEEDELHHLFDENESYEPENSDINEEEISLFRLFGDNK